MKMKKILAAAMAAALLTGTLAMGGCSSDSGKLVMVCLLYTSRCV